MNIKMKKRIRKIVAGICLASAVAVAAIPADNSGFAQAENPTETLGYEADSLLDRNGILSAPSNSPNLSASSNNAIKYSFRIMENGGTWQLSWEYQYYTETYNSSNIGVISKYNDSLYNVDTLTLSSTINTGYEFVKVSDYNTWEGTLSSVSFHLQYPTQDCTTSGSDGLSCNTKFLDVQKYFPDEYQAFVTRYNNALTQYAQMHPGSSAPSLDDLKAECGYSELTLYANTMSEANKRIYYCDTHNLSGYTLVLVTNQAQDLPYIKDATGNVGTNDKIPNETSIYIVRTISGEKSGESTDDNGFKLLSTQNITAIGQNAFKDTQRVNNMVVDAQIAYIGDSAFENSYIRNVQFGGVLYIGNYVFRDCKYLTSVTFTEKTQIIGKEAFYHCPQLTEVVITSGVQQIGFGAFANCQNLKTVDLSSCTNVNIGEYAFYDCLNLTNVKFASASSKASIGKAAFALSSNGSASQMTEFNFPELIDQYISAANNGSSSGDNPYSDFRLGDFILANRSVLKTVTMPSNFGDTSTETVPSHTFAGCFNLEKVIFPDTDTLADFDSELFKDITNAEFCVHGPGFRSPGAGSSSNNSSSNNNYAQPRMATWATHTAASEYVPYVYTIDNVEHYEVGIEPYRYELKINDDNTATLQSCQFIDPNKQEIIDILIVPGTVAKYTVTTLAEGCFDGTSSNDSVKNYIRNLWVMDNSILEIGDSVFQNCKELEAVLLGNSVQIIGEDAFADNPKLTSVVIGAGIATVDEGAFNNCPEMEYVVWDSPNSYNLADIAADAFKTNSSVLYFVGDIKSGYAPFEYAMGDYTINEQSTRICYVMPMVNTNNVTVSGGSNTYASYDMIGYYPDYGYSPLADGGAGVCEGCENCENCSNGETCDGCEYCEDGNCENCENCEDCDCTKGTEEPSSPTSPPSTSDSETTGIQVTLPTAAIYVIHDDMTDENLLIDYPHYGDLPKDLRDIYEGKTTDSSLNSEQWALLNATMYLKLPQEVTSIDVKSFLDNDNNNTNRVNWIYIGDSSNWLGGSVSQRDIYANDNLTLSGTEDANLQERYESTGGYHAGLFSGYYVDIDSLTAYGDNPNNYQTKGNDWLLTIEMPGVVSIPDYAFDSCERLQSIIISDACKEIGVGAFQNCDSLAAIGTGNSTKFIFDNYILYEVKDDGTYQLDICLPARGKDLSSSGIYINSSNDPRLSKVSSLGDNAFTNCDGIISVDLSGTSVRAIPDETFKGCRRLTSVTLPNTVRTIGDDAFIGMATSVDITIPSDCNVSATAFDDKNITTIWTYPTCELIIETFGDPDHNKYPNIFTRYLGSVYTITFLNDDYSVFEKIEVESGRDGSYPEKEPTPQLKVHEGCAFDGWYFDNENGIRNVTENRTAVATFAPRIFKITYLNDDGTVYEIIEVPEGYNGSYPAVDPTPKLAMHTGYKFSGWSFTNGNGVENVHEDRTAVATFSLDGTNSPSANQPGNGSNGGNGGNGNGNGSTSGNSASGNNVSSNGVRYNVVVENGAGGGSYEPGKVVTITAYAAPAGRVFDRWTTSNSDIGFSNAYGVSTTFIMPSHDVKVTATYKQQTASGNSASGNNTNNNNNGNNSGNGGSTSGNNAGGNNGNKTDVTITTDTIDNNHKNLASATVAGSTDNFVVKITDSAAAYAAVEQALRAQYGDLSNVRFVGFDISLYDETGTRKIENTNGLAVTITIPIPDDLVPYAGNNKAAGVVNGVLDPMTVRFTTIDGVPCMQFTATHFSPYTIYVNTNYLVSGVTDETPKTGDGIHPKWFLAAGLACLSVVLFAWKDKKKVVVK